MPNDVITETIAILQRMKANGEKYVSICPENISALSKVIQRPKQTTNNEPIVAKITPVVTQAATTTVNNNIVAPPQSTPVVPNPTTNSLQQNNSLNELKEFCFKNYTQENKKIIFDEGNTNPKIMLICDTLLPATSEQNAVISGPARELLDKMLTAMGTTYQQCYTTSIVKIPLPTKRNPNKEELNHWKPIIEQQIKIINPQVIILLGAISMSTLLGQNDISTNNGKWHKIGGNLAMPIYHPLYILGTEGTQRNQQIKKDVWNALKSVIAYLDQK